MLSLINLQSFCAAYEQKSFSGAARVLMKDRTTVREHVSVLEDIYDISLFSVEGKRLVPTDAATLIYERAKITLVNAGQLDSALLGIHNSHISELTVYHDTLIPLGMISLVNREVNAHYPHVRMNWLHRNTDESLKLLAQGSSCLAITQRNLNTLKSEPVNYLALGSERLSIYSGKNSNFPARAIHTFTDLQAQKQYVTENQFNWRPDLFCVSPDRHIISNTDVLIELLTLDGWAILPTEVAKPYLDADILKEVSVDKVVNHVLCDLTLYYPPHLEDNPVMQLIRKLASSYASENLV
ncbi:LysR family transcriptional regulator [Parasalinivibrio latis]|uniref:LysR family transcriptional regulator n=1 Tax=Parasalinivibrio latis TaxID=2952610 RepID=UPI0030DEF865